MNEELEIEDYFGHATEDGFLDWASVQFKEHRDVEVTDKSEMVYQFVSVSSEGCCELCYSEDVRVFLSYKDVTLNFSGWYAYNDTDYELTLCDFRVVEDGK